MASLPTVTFEMIARVHLSNQPTDYDPTGCEGIYVERVEITETNRVIESREQPPAGLTHDHTEMCPNCGCLRECPARATECGEHRPGGCE